MDVGKIIYTRYLKCLGFIIIIEELLQLIKHVSNNQKLNKHHSILVLFPNEVVGNLE